MKPSPHPSRPFAFWLTTAMYGQIPSCEHLVVPCCTLIPWPQIICFTQSHVTTRTTCHNIWWGLRGINNIYVPNGFDLSHAFRTRQPNVIAPMFPWFSLIFHVIECWNYSRLKNVRKTEQKSSRECSMIFHEYKLMPCVRFNDCSHFWQGCLYPTLYPTT